MQLEARAARQSVGDQGRLVPAVVVQHQVNLQLFRHGLSAEGTGLKRMVRMVTLVAEISGDEARAMASRDYVELQADLAAVFHWQPSEMRRLAISEAARCPKLALARARALTGRGRRGHR